MDFSDDSAGDIRTKATRYKLEFHVGIRVFNLGEETHTNNRKTIVIEMAIGIARQHSFQGIRPVQWLHSAKTAWQVPGVLHVSVSRTPLDVPQALASDRSARAGR